MPRRPHPSCVPVKLVACSQACHSSAHIVQGSDPCCAADAMAMNPAEPPARTPAVAARHRLHPCGHRNVLTIVVMPGPQAEAERRKRAQILESEGDRQSKINVAEGEKAQVILSSEAAKQDSINRAEGAPRDNCTLDPCLPSVAYVILQPWCIAMSA